MYSLLYVSEAILISILKAIAPDCLVILKFSNTPKATKRSVPSINHGSMVDSGEAVQCLST